MHPRGNALLIFFMLHSAVLCVVLLRSAATWGFPMLASVKSCKGEKSHTWLVCTRQCSYCRPAHASIYEYSTWAAFYRQVCHEGSVFRLPHAFIDPCSTMCKRGGAYFSHATLGVVLRGRVVRTPPEITAHLVCVCFLARWYNGSAWIIGSKSRVYDKLAPRWTNGFQHLIARTQHQWISKNANKSTYNQPLYLDLFLFFTVILYYAYLLPQHVLFIDNYVFVDDP